MLYNLQLWKNKVGSEKFNDDQWESKFFLEKLARLQSKEYTLKPHTQYMCSCFQVSTTWNRSYRFKLQHIFSFTIRILAGAKVDELVVTPTWYRSIEHNSRKRQLDTESWSSASKVSNLNSRRKSRKKNHVSLDQSSSEPQPKRYKIVSEYVFVVSIEKKRKARETERKFERTTSLALRNKLAIQDKRILFNHTLNLSITMSHAAYLKRKAHWYFLYLSTNEKKKLREKKGI